MKKIKQFIAGIKLKRKIIRIGRDMGDINSMMIIAGWDRNRRRNYWREIVTAIKRYA